MARQAKVLLIALLILPMLHSNLVKQNLKPEEWLSERILPDGCGKAFQDVAEFRSFFELAINQIAAKSGVLTTPIAELFAVEELARAFNTKFMKFGRESPIDRLVISQICQFNSIIQSATTGDVYIGIKTSDERLHKHLTSIAFQLYRDARQLYLETKNEHLKLKKNPELTKRKIDRIQRAKKSAKVKISTII